MINVVQGSMRERIRTHAVAIEQIVPLMAIRSFFGGGGHYTVPPTSYYQDS